MMLAFGAAGAALGSAVGAGIVGGAMMPLWYGQLWSGLGWTLAPELGYVLIAADDDL